jgi:hypothetical protein
VQDAAVTLEGLLASAKQVIGEEGWTEVDDGTTEAAEKASAMQRRPGRFHGILDECLVQRGLRRTLQILDNALLGIPQMKESAVLEVVTKVARKQIQ